MKTILNVVMVILFLELALLIYLGYTNKDYKYYFIALIFIVFSLVVYFAPEKYK